MTRRYYPRSGRGIIDRRLPGLSQLSARELLDGYAALELSPVEVVAACLERVDALDGDLNAWQALCRERARQDARAAEAAWRARAPTGPLCGVPIAIKDLFDTAGLETACGSMLLQGRVPAADAEVVRRVRDAGAIVLGKTSTHEFACGLTMVNEHLGDTRNPFDRARTPGGSSGGSAVALATGMAPLAVGTDTGGSIRWPAAACGIVGFKPSFGAVSLEGCWPLAASLDHAGPMARTVADAALLFEVLRTEPAQPVPERLRIVMPDHLGLELDPAVGEALAGAAERSRAAGLEVGGTEVLDHMHARAVFFGTFHPEILRTHTELGLWPARKAEYTANVRTRLGIAEGFGDAEYATAQRERDAMRASVAAALVPGTLMLTPVCGRPVPRFDDLAAIRDYVTPLTCPQDLLGAPACAVRAGTDANGLPVGLQITGAPGADDAVLAAAGALEAALATG